MATLREAMPPTVRLTELPPQRHGIDPAPGHSPSGHLPSGHLVPDHVPDMPDAPDQPSPLPLSATIICCNNQDTIGRCIDSVKDIAAEVIAVDSGSTDDTVAILEAAGATVIYQDFLGHVQQKQFALDRATQPWVVHLDSDESLEPDLRDAIVRAVREDEPSVAGYEVNRRVWWAGGFLNHAWQPEYRLRLVRRDRARWAGYNPHDRLEIIPSPAGTAPARTVRLDGIMRHDSIPDMPAFLARQVSHARIAADSYIAMGRRGSVASLIAAPVSAWARQIFIRGAWRDGWRGWAAASATAAGALMKHAILLERTRRADKP